MKKIVFVILLLSLVFCVFAQSSKELSETVNLAVMQGPTGFSSAMLEDYIKVSVYPSPNETVAKLVNGELDMAVLPANTAANLYNKGIGIKVVAIVGEGMLSVVGTSSEESSEETKISVPGAGGTPDHMATLLYPEYERNYSITAPAQLAQMLIAQKVTMAILPQPFVSMVLSKNPNIKVIDDVQKRWKKSTGLTQYPMSVLVVTDKFDSAKPDLVERVMADYKKSIEKVLENPHEAALIIEQKGIMKAELAEPAIKDCAIVFEKGRSAEKELFSYYEVLKELAPDAIGGKMPDSDLFR